MNVKLLEKIGGHLLHNQWNNIGNKQDSFCCEIVTINTGLGFRHDGWRQENNQQLLEGDRDPAVIWGNFFPGNLLKRNVDKKILK